MMFQRQVVINYCASLNLCKCLKNPSNSSVIITSQLGAQGLKTKLRDIVKLMLHSYTTSASWT